MEPEIVSSVPGSFPWSVLHERHPRLVAQVRDTVPYPPETLAALDALLAESTTGDVARLPGGATGGDTWDGWGRGCYGARWDDVPFLWAESYFYRRLLEAVGFFAPGPWQGVDPFAPVKQAELDDPSLDRQLSELDALASLDPGDRRTALLHACVWGNRADLGFRLSASAAGGDHADDLLVDDSAALWRHLDAHPGGRVVVLADNAGRELIPDLILIDHLLEAGLAAQVLLHVKPYPYFVSDATTADVLAALHRLSGAPGATASGIGDRLGQALRTGRLSLRAHEFSAAPLPYRQAPADLLADVATATVTLLKGDLNYRRLVGDRIMPPDTAFAQLTAYLPGPVAALRTVKCEVVAGIPADLAARLDAGEPHWRIRGTHAMVQFRP